MRLPPPLAAGARVALAAPAGPLRASGLERAIAQCRAFGWEAVGDDSLLARTGYLAGDDAHRAAHLNALLARADIDGIWCLRGGYGATRILDALDFDALCRHPKALIGFSDVTALHAAVSVRCGFATFHGPNAHLTLTDFSRQSFVRAVIEQRDPCGEAAEARVLRPGRARGRLVGGNLAVLTALCGTRYMPDLSGGILVLEDVGEETYRIDRMLRQLLHVGALDSITGIAYGHFTEGSAADDPYSRPLDDVLVEAADVARVPALAGIPMGHIDDQWTLPLGVLAELDADARTLHVHLPAPPAPSPSTPESHEVRR